MRLFRVLLLACGLFLLSPRLLAQFGYFTNGGAITLVSYTGTNSVVTLSNFVTSIGDSAFGQAFTLANLTIPNGVTNIGNNAFDECVILTNINIPASVTSIGDSAFYGCSHLPSITLSNGLMTIGELAFDDCPSLSGITIPGTVTNIGEEAFENCPAMTAITVNALNANYTSADGVLFDKSQSTLLEFPAGGSGNYTIPDGVTTIATEAFLSCYQLTNVTIAPSVTNIGAFAFDDCSGLTTLTIPANVSSIGSDVFFYCSKLASINVSPANASYSSLNGVLFNKDRTTLLEFPPGGAGTYSIPDSVTTIADSAFLSCGGVTGINIPDSITSIGAQAFALCSALVDITIPASVTNIGTYAFELCSSLTDVLFAGNAPALDPTMFVSANNATLYYLPEALGWTSPFNSRPAFLWNPAIQTNGGNFGLHSGQFGFTVNGTTSIPLVIQATTNLTTGPWSVLQSCTLTNGSIFVADPAAAGYRDRFYSITFP